MKRYSPDELYEKFRAARDAVSAKEFFNRPEHKKTQELWCAAQFGKTFLANISLCSIWASDRDEQTDADFYLEVEGIDHAFQITEVQVPGRRRGDEYKNERTKEATLEDWDVGTQSGPAWIRRAIHKKYDRYGGNVAGLNLLVYANFPDYEQEYEDIRHAVSDLAAKFASVWVLRGNGACCVGGSKALGDPRPWLYRHNE